MTSGTPAQVERYRAEWLDSTAAWTIEPLPHGNSVDLVLASDHDAALAAQARRVAELEGALAWQPIETAPFNVTVLALFKGRQHVIATRRPDNESPSGWCHQEASFDDGPNRGITAWMPLPPPAAALKGQG